MKNIKKHLATTALAASMALAVAGCGGGSSAPSSSASDSLTLLVPNTFTSLDPAFTNDSSTKVIVDLIYDRLVAVDNKSGKIEPQLASSWEITPTSARFDIAKDAKCADGSSFTAQTALKNFERMKDPAKPSPKANSAFSGTAYEASVEGNSVKLTFAKPIPFPERRVSDYITMVCDAGLADPAALEKNSFGTGPYVLESATAADTYQLRLRDDASAYTWGVNGAKITDKMPKKITVRMLKDNDTAINLINSGRADALLTSESAAKRLSDVKSSVVAETGNTYLLFNHRPGSQAETTDVRIAVSQLIDRNGYLQTSANGVGKSATSLTAADGQCSAADVAKLSEGGAEAATKTLEKAGWTKTDGKWMKDGKPLTFRLLNAGEPPAGAQYLSTVLSEFGIDAKLDTRSGAEAVAALRAGEEWEGVLMSTGSSTPPLTLLQGLIPPKGSNFGAIKNQKFDDAVAKAITTGTGGDCSLWNAAEQALLDQADLDPLTTSSLVFVSPNWNLGDSTVAASLIATSLQPR